LCASIRAQPAAWAVECLHQGSCIVYLHQGSRIVCLHQGSRILYLHQGSGIVYLHQGSACCLGSRAACSCRVLSRLRVAARHINARQALVAPICRPDVRGSHNQCAEGAQAKGFKRLWALCGYGGRGSCASADDAGGQP